jgi:hypothetical protein
MVAHDLILSSRIPSLLSLSLSTSLERAVDRRFPSTPFYLTHSHRCFIDGYRNNRDGLSRLLTSASERRLSHDNRCAKHASVDRLLMVISLSRNSRATPRDVEQDLSIGYPFSCLPDRSIIDPRCPASIKDIKPWLSAWLSEPAGADRWHQRWCPPDPLSALAVTPSGLGWRVCQPLNHPQPGRYSSRGMGHDPRSPTP